LLPIADMPLVVLAAKRAGNTGKKVLVVTSDQPSDDLLCCYLRKHKIEFYRGDLDNVLSRFVSATKNMKNRTIVFRLTADNVFPDGELINELEREFIATNAEYLVCNGHKSGLPYGLSVEVFRLEAIRKAIENTQLEYDLEHVTPYVIKHGKVDYFNQYSEMKLGNYRCTVDNFDDYISVAKVFSDIENPEDIEWKELVKILVKNNYHKVFTQSAEKMVIGGVQFGLDYGISNTLGRPNMGTINSIISTAVNNNSYFIDTAKDYGNSEKRIGKVIAQSNLKSRLKIVTKLSALDNYPNDSDLETIRALVRESVYSSCFNLGLQNVDYLMLHRAEHLTKWQGCVWDELLQLKSLGVINKLGVSVQNQAELIQVLDVDNVEIIQMPYNIVDRRWDDGIKVIQSIKTKRELTIHVRSVFLQGLLLTKDRNLWYRANVEEPDLIIKLLEGFVKKFNRISTADLCLAYARSHDWIDGVIVGMNSIEQLHDNLIYFNQPLLDKSKVSVVNSAIPIFSDKVLNPSNWRT
jgi:spore coat polysaccharide biosynthesis protein SpsF (cytidylyltransferase family)/aryl-alcohol dehydrogenase-like predicted oxidoreductase